MNRSRVAGIAIDAFYDSFTCAALFRKLRIPGSPREVVDPRPARTFWADESQQILANAMAMLKAIHRLIPGLGKGDSKKPTTEGEDIETFLAGWTSYIKP
jgi:hypothetical protein